MSQPSGNGHQPPFGRYIKAAIAAAGFRSPTAFARTAGRDPSVVLRWISGQARPDAATLSSVAPFLKVPVSELMTAAYPDEPADAQPVNEPASTGPPAPVDIGPELATIDGLAMWMRPDFHPLGFLLHHAALDEKARFTVALEMREVTDRAVLQFLDALAAMVRREGGKVRPEAWPAHLVDRFGWTVPDGEESDGDGP